jgi:hypothetical protein
MHDLISDFARNRERIPWEFSDMEEREEERLPRGMRVLEPHEIEGDLLTVGEEYAEKLRNNLTKPFRVGLLEYLSNEVVDGVSRGWS